MSGLCADRVVIVTGAGGGIGRFHALELARQGAKVVVNDRGVARDGTGNSDSPADLVVQEIREAGGVVVADHSDVSDLAAAASMVRTAVEEFGELHAVVNNAGILRDRTLVNMSEDDWDAVIRVHLKGTFAPAQAAARYWRDRAKAGARVDARLINTTSTSGLFGNVGQANYGAAKAGIASFTVIAAMEMARYGVCVNAVSPGARTRMTDGLMADPGDDFDPYDPQAISPLVAWLVSTGSKGVTGQVFGSHGGFLSVMSGWEHGPSRDVQRLYQAGEIDTVVRELLAAATPNPRLAAAAAEVG